MESETPGKDTFQIEVANVSPHGFWLFVDQRELFVPFRDFAWFSDATIAEITNVRLTGTDHLYWPALDADLSVDSIEHPGKYPLVSQKPQHLTRPAKE